MKKTVFIISLFCLFNCSKDEVNTSQPIIIIGELDAVKTYGGSKNDVAQSVVKTIDGGYAVLGHSQSNNGDLKDKTNESFDFWVMKFTANNSLLWSKTFGGTEDDRGNDIIQTADGGFAILGFTQSSNGDVIQNNGSKDFWVAKLTTTGILTWQKSFGFSGSDYGTSLIQTNDNGYLLTGVIDVTASGGEGNSRTSQRHAGGDIWAVKLSAVGNFEWSKYFGGSFTDTAFGVEKTADNGFIIVGSSDSDDVDISDNKGSYDFWVLKISSSGTLLWEKSFGGTEIDEARAITSTTDGNFIIVGDTRSSDVNVSNNNGAADLWMLKISPEGNLLWEKTIGATGFDVARSVSKSQDNGFIISGSSRSSDGGYTNQGQNDAWVLKTDANGNILWQKTVGGTEIDFFYDAVELNNLEIIAVGESSSSNGDIEENKGFSDVLIIKIK
tara:strand:+ start:3854 stop:5176 length:1323 start_codon:yes stop_codon:yes gene_type:complete